MPVVKYVVCRFGQRRLLKLSKVTPPLTSNLTSNPSLHLSPLTPHPSPLTPPLPSDPSPYLWLLVPPGVQPVRETWDDDCTLVLQQMLCNRILSVRILGQSKGTALVEMADQASDPQADVAKLLISMGYAAPATSPHDTEDTAAPGVEGAAAQGRTLVLEEILGEEDEFLITTITFTFTSSYIFYEGEGLQTVFN